MLNIPSAALEAPHCTVPAEYQIKTSINCMVPQEIVGHEVKIAGNGESSPRDPNLSCQSSATELCSLNDGILTVMPQLSHSFVPTPGI